MSSAFVYRCRALLGCDAELCAVFVRRGWIYLLWLRLSYFMLSMLTF